MRLVHLGNGRALTMDDSLNLRPTLPQERREHFKPVHFLRLRVELLQLVQDALTVGCIRLQPKRASKKECTVKTASARHSGG